MPCVIQDWRSGEVLTLAYMNAEALALSRLDGRAAPVQPQLATSSGTRAPTSGNTQAVKALRFDCDNDAVLALVEPKGPACHTGERTCFFTGDTPSAALRGPARPRADAARTGIEPAARLLHEPAPADPPFIGEKVQEEAEEVARAAREESDERVAEEAADVLYHLTVLLHSRGLALKDAEEVLLGRRR